MHNILVNALGVTNQSGRAVLVAHLDGLLEGLGLCCRFHLLVAENEIILRTHFGDRVSWRLAPAATSKWPMRVFWEFMHLADEAVKCHASLYFTPSGIASRRLSIPQVVFCMNPWPLVPAARRHRDGLKAWLQRMAYRDTVKRATAMVYLSRFMQSAYRQNAGMKCAREVIAYQPVDCTGAEKSLLREPGRVACVSVMAPHKNVETVLRAFQRVRHLPNTHLHLVGGWPDPAYKTAILQLARELGIEGQIVLDGHVSREELMIQYAKARVFCLMSRCESFGIPAVEAQSYGTPVVSSNVCAIPEICGDGGVYHDPDDVAGVARSLELLLSDPNVWQDLSVKAHRNVRRFSADACSESLCKLFGDLLEIKDGKKGTA